MAYYRQISSVLIKEKCKIIHDNLAKPRNVIKPLNKFRVLAMNAAFICWILHCVSFVEKNEQSSLSVALNETLFLVIFLLELFAFFNAQL